MRCEICDKFIKHKGRTISMVCPAFCSFDCFLTYISKRESGSLDTLFLYDKRVRPNPGSDVANEYFSPILCNSFRSRAEACFAEFIRYELKISIFYEPVILKIGNGKRYIPDFYLPSADLFLEVKGDWWPGSKRKFCKGQDILGKKKLILIPPEYFSWFNKKDYILE
jgi:hypothetical protein